jgi:hypothetical protein
MTEAALAWTPAHGRPRRIRVVDTEAGLVRVEEEGHRDEFDGELHWREVGRESVRAFDLEERD